MRAARLLGAAAAPAEQTEGVLEPVYRRDFSESLEAPTRVALTEAAFTAAYTEGRTLARDETVAPCRVQRGHGASDRVESGEG